MHTRVRVGNSAFANQQAEESDLPDGPHQDAIHSTHAPGQGMVLATALETDDGTAAGTAATPLGRTPGAIAGSSPTPGTPLRRD